MVCVTGCLFFFLLGQDDTIILLLEPLHGVFLRHLVASTNLTLSSLSSSDSLSWPLKNYVEIHTCWVQANKIQGQEGGLVHWFFVDRRSGGVVGHFLGDKNQLQGWWVSRVQLCGSTKILL